MNDSSTSRATVTFTGDKSTGVITSKLSKGTSNAGTIFGAAMSSAYYDITLNNCGSGGTVNGTAVTADNFQNRGIIYGYAFLTNTTVTFNDC